MSRLYVWSYLYVLLKPSLQQCNMKAAFFPCVRHLCSATVGAWTHINKADANTLLQLTHGEVAFLCHVTTEFWMQSRTGYLFGQHVNYTITLLNWRCGTWTTSLWQSTNRLIMLTRTWTRDHYSSNGQTHLAIYNFTFTLLFLSMEYTMWASFRNHNLFMFKED